MPGRGFASGSRGPAGFELHLSTVPNRINVNAAQLEQVVMTVIDRARHLMSSQGKITIETARLDIHEDVRRGNSPLQPGAYAALDIRVPGPVPQGEARISLFECLVPGKEPWDETAAAVSRAYGVLHQWGGDLLVLSGAQGECIYRILLPRTEMPVPQPAVPELQAPPEPEPHRATILVVEDEAGIRALVRKILRRQNYEVIEAANGEEALAICRDNPAEIDLLITDVIMPQMGGRDLADRLREQGRVMKSAVRLRLHRRRDYLFRPASARIGLPSKAVYARVAARQGAGSFGRETDLVRGVHRAVAELLLHEIARVEMSLWILLI